MANTVSFGIKLQMADIGKAITDSVKGMKPVKLPTDKMAPETAATFQKISETYTPNTKQQSTGDMISGWINNPKNPLSKTGIGKAFDKYRTIIAEQGKKIHGGFKNVMGGLEERTKMSGGAMKDAWSRFNAELSSSSSMGEAMSAFKGLGDGVVKAFTRMSTPISGTILLVAALTKTLTDFSKEVEDSINRMNQAFKSGGRMKGVGAEKYTGIYGFVEDQTMQGNIDRASFMKSMARVRSTALSLDEKTFDKAMRQSIDLGAYLGVDKGEALEQYAEILNGLNFTYEDGIKLGTAFSRSEISLINALKQSGNQAEANAKIMKKVAEQTKGSQDEYAKTLSGKYEKLSSKTKSIMQNLGKIFEPLMKLALDFANGLLTAANWIVKAFSDFFQMIYDGIGEMLEDITGYDFGFKTTNGNEGNEEQQKEAENWIDPRRQLSVNFEDASSMSSRIQKSILERQSPQVKMVDLLTKINEKVDEIGNGQKKTAGINEQQVNETRVTNTTLRKQNVGLQYG